MPLVTQESLLIAVRNVASFGDTDIFPFPIENHLFHDLPEEVCSVLSGIDEKFEKALTQIPVLTAKELSAVGYSGFRLGTQIDPLWNAYLLALLVTVSAELESRRVPKTTVFSYRIKIDAKSATLFDRNVGWAEFQSSIKERAKQAQYVLRCDISDFYPRIYHHRLENALTSATSRPDITSRVMRLLLAISEGPSYGLPVGGPAARILSEALLNRVDKLLLSENIKFCRFVDDYVIFADSFEAAHSALITLTRLLLQNEGLALQKAKTRVMTATEFLATSDFSDAPAGESAEDERARTFRRLRIHFDPYSPTAEADYRKLARELSKFDIVAMLGRELSKSRIDEGLTRRLVTATRLLPRAAQNDAVRSMLRSLDLLYPIFPAVMQLCRALQPKLSDSVREAMYTELRSLIRGNSYITQVPSNLAFALRVLATDPSEETELLVAATHKASTSMMIRRDAILIMASRTANYWVSNCRLSFPTVTAWERRALLVASFTLGDEGAYWRKSLQKNLNEFDRLVVRWTKSNFERKGATWRVPI